MNLRKNKDDLAKDKKLLHKYIYNNNNVFFLKMRAEKNPRDQEIVFENRNFVK